MVERAALLAPDHTIRASDLGTSLGGDPPPAEGAEGDEASALPALDLATLEGMAIEEALRRAEWHQGRAARLLGISDRTLHRKIRALGLRRPD